MLVSEHVFASTIIANKLPVFSFAIIGTHEFSTWQVSQKAQAYTTVSITQIAMFR